MYNMFSTDYYQLIFLFTFESANMVQPVKGSRGTIAALSKPTSEGGWIDQ